MQLLRPRCIQCTLDCLQRLRKGQARKEFKGFLKAKGVHRELFETRKDLAAVRSAKAELEGKVSSAEKIVAGLKVQQSGE